MYAEVFVKFRINNLGRPKDLHGVVKEFSGIDEEFVFETTEEMVKWLIHEEGLLGLVELGEDEYDVIEIKLAHDNEKICDCGEKFVEGDCCSVCQEKTITF